MATRAEIAAVFTGGVLQGITLVTFPACAAIFTSAQHYALSNTEYGGMFVPQAIAAIVASLLGAGLTRRLGGKHLLLFGLVADLLSMALLLASQFVAAQHALAYGLLLTATGFLGVGFGLVIPALNTFTAAFFPANVGRAILNLNALMGLGTALAPIFAAIFVGLGFWWGLPLLMAGLNLALILFVLGLALPDAPVSPDPDGQTVRRSGIPIRFWLYAAFALMYGVCETLNANWAAIYLARDLAASTTLASLALTSYWIAVTVGRILFALIVKWVPERVIFCVLPIVVALAFAATASTPHNQPILAMMAIVLTGLGCSALLPLVISFGQGELVSMRAAVAGGLIGTYEMGYGITAFGVGPLISSTGLGLSQIYGGIAGAAVIMALLALALARRMPTKARS